MSSARDKIDLEAYLRERVVIQNTEGGRGFDHGVRRFDCPWCDDERSRGWMNVEFWTAGCFNAGCPAEPRIDGGALEWARAVENFKTFGKTLAYLQAKYPQLIAPKPRPLPVDEYKDWCRLPRDMKHFVIEGPSMMQGGFIDFAQRQWGLGMMDLMKAPAGWCIQGKHAWRIIFPIFEDRKLIAFQGRAIRSSSEMPIAKYLTSRHGPSTDLDNECGRPAEAILYGLDQIRPDEELIVVEGIGDVLALRKQGRVAVALLGTQLTSEKIALIRKRRPGRVIVGLDTQNETEGTSIDVHRNLLAWGIDAVTGKWAGGKDAGSGAKLCVAVGGIAENVSRRLSRSLTCVAARRLCVAAREDEHREVSLETLDVLDLETLDVLDL